MKKLLTLMVLGAVVLFAAGNARAQCCDDPNPTLSGDQCGMIDPATSSSAGCVDLGGGNCVGGNLDDPTDAEGCACVMGNCEADGDNDFNDTAADCTAAAGAACCGSATPNCM